MREKIVKRKIPLWIRLMLHLMILPITSVMLFDIYGYLYLLLPTTMYLTVSQNSDGVAPFFTIMIIIGVFAIAGWTDASITNIYEIQKEM